MKINEISIRLTYIHSRELKYNNNELDLSTQANKADSLWLTAISKTLI